MKVVCPHCGSVRIRTVDTVLLLTPVSDWYRDDDGELRPNNFEDGEVNYDTSEPSDALFPYDCADCGEPIDEPREVTPC